MNREHAKHAGVPITSLILIGIAVTYYVFTTNHVPTQDIVSDDTQPIEYRSNDTNTGATNVYKNITPPV